MLGSTVGSCPVRFWREVGRRQVGQRMWLGGRVVTAIEEIWDARSSFVSDIRAAF